MSMHPELTTTIYAVIAVVFAVFMIGLFVYTRKMNLNKASMSEKGRPPLNKEEGILIATREKEGRGGPPPSE